MELVLVGEDIKMTRWGRSEVIEDATQGNVSPGESGGSGGESVVTEEPEGKMVEAKMARGLMERR
jgi:hypothetical protein